MEMVCSFIQIETIFIGLFFASPYAASEFAKTVAFGILLTSYCLMMIVYYLRLRIEILKWLIEKEYNGKIFIFIRTLFFGIVNVS
jgi:hypothetical protein